MKIRAVIVPPKANAYVAEIDNTLESMQKLVDGYIELYSPFNHLGILPGIIVVCNEEGVLSNLPRNRLGIRGQFICLSDEIVGDGDFKGLSRVKARRLISILNGGE